MTVFFRDLTNGKTYHLDNVLSVICEHSFDSLGYFLTPITIVLHEHPYTSICLCQNFEVISIF